MGDKAKKRDAHKARISENVEPFVETHMQMFRRLSDPMFLSGAMHGKPGSKVKKSH